MAAAAVSSYVEAQQRFEGGLVSHALAAEMQAGCFTFCTRIPLPCCRYYLMFRAVLVLLADIPSASCSTLHPVTLHSRRYTLEPVYRVACQMHFFD
jgi:hypothetical protein